MIDRRRTGEVRRSHACVYVHIHIDAIRSHVYSLRNLRAQNVEITETIVSKMGSVS